MIWRISRADRTSLRLPDATRRDRPGRLVPPRHHVSECCRSLFMCTRTENRYARFMVRRTNAVMGQEAVEDLAEVLGRIGVVTDVLSREQSTGDERIDAVVEVAGQRFEVEVKSVITAAHGAHLAGIARPDVPLIVVAERIAADAKQSLREAGVNYFDRRGELRVVAPPLIVHTNVETTLAAAGIPSGSLDSQVAKEVAIACLLTPDCPHGVRRIARYIERAPSAVSKAMARLRDDGLLTSAGEALVPDLFHALLSVWRRRAVLLAALPELGTREARRLGLGLDKPEDSTGWALTDTRAAASWGIPIVATGDYPPDFYVPSKSSLRAAHTHLGEATSSALRACTVAVAPVRLACLRRVNHSRTTGEQWPVANHIVVALDIAQDRARGLEALEQWKPEGIARAW